MGIDALTRYLEVTPKTVELFDPAGRGEPAGILTFSAPLGGECAGHCVDQARVKVGRAVSDCKAKSCHGVSVTNGKTGESLELYGILAGSDPEYPG